MKSRLFNSVGVVLLSVTLHGAEINLITIQKPPVNQSGNLIFNGGFEAPGLGAAGAFVLTNGSTSVPGWVPVDNASILNQADNLYVSAPYYGHAASEGAHFIYLDNNSFGNALNLLVNGSFESAATAWNFTGGLSTFGPPETEPLGVDGGRIASLGGGNIPNSTLFQTFSVMPNSNYRVSLATAADGDDYAGRTGIVRVDVIASDNAVLASKSFTNVSPGPILGTNGFVKRMFTFATPANVTSATLRITDTSPNGGDSVDPLIDNVVVLGDPNLIRNGSFEEPMLPAGYAHVDPTQFPFWQTTDDTFEVWADPANAIDGAQSIEILSHAPSATVFQTVETQSGREYTLSFYHSPRPSVNSALTVQIDSHTVATFMEGGAALTELNWQRFQTNFTASSNFTTIAFSDVSAAGSGTHIDKVGVYLASPTLNGIYQDFATLAGNTYQVTFDAATEISYGTPGLLAVAAGETVMRYTLPNVNAFPLPPSLPYNFVGWFNYSFTFTATDRLTRLQFFDEGVQIDGNPTTGHASPLLDNVWVSLVNTSLVVSVLPTNRIALVGQNFVIAAQYLGAGPFAFQWYYKGRKLAGQTNASLSLPNIQLRSRGDYQVEVRNNVSVVRSDLVRLAVVIPPTIVSKPRNIALRAGKRLTLRVAAKGSKPFSYQWFKDGDAIDYGTNRLFNIPNVQAADAGVYAVRVSNAGAFQERTNAVLTVTP